MLRSSDNAQSMLFELLGAAADNNAADYAWALRHALSFLLPVDAARLVVALLESGGSQARASVHWLRFGDAPLPPMDENALLDEAAGHACWRALVLLLEDLRAKSPPWVTLHDDKITDVQDLKNDTQAQRATIAHRGTHYRFGHDVLKIAATRSDLKVIQWLLPRSATASGQLEPMRRDRDDRLETVARTEAVMEAAADARHFDILEWMVSTSSLLHCVLPYDDELEAMCWIIRDSQDPRWCTYFCATKTYGFSRAYSRTHASADGMTNASVTDMPLADAFARDGDLNTLKKMFARPNGPQLIGAKAITLAAECGHLEIVQWIYELLPRFVRSSCFLGAARGGHLPILEWMRDQPGFVIIPRAIVEAAAHGHVHVLHWYRSIDSSQKPHFENVALTRAISDGHLDVVTFLHEECETPLDSQRLLEPLSKCPSIETLDYVLDRIEPIRLPSLFLKRVVGHSNLEIVQHLIFNRGLWSPDALSAAVTRSDPVSALEMSQFLFAQAQERARHLQTPLKDQVQLTDITIRSVWHYSVAVWLLTSVPDVTVWDSYFVSLGETHVAELSWRPILIACIKHRPSECRALSWFPEWAVRVNSFDALELLEQCGHPQLRAHDTFHCVATHTRDSRFMLKLLPLPDDKPKLRREIVDWAAKFGMITVLDRVLDREEPGTQRQLLKRVAHHVGVSGHIEMADWLLQKWFSLEVSSLAMLKSISLDAVCHGHIHVLQWLQDHQLMPTRPHAMESMVLVAGNARQVRGLQWLLSNATIAIPPKWLARVVVDAERQNHTEIVEFITRAFEPADLPVRDQDLERIRLYLQKQQSHTETVALTVDESIHQDASASGRQAKRPRAR